MVAHDHRQVRGSWQAPPRLSDRIDYRDPAATVDASHESLSSAQQLSAMVSQRVNAGASSMASVGGRYCLVRGRGDWDRN
jgi:hypothetical protein